MLISRSSPMIENGGELFELKAVVDNAPLLESVVKEEHQDESLHAVDVASDGDDRSDYSQYSADPSKAPAAQSDTTLSELGYEARKEKGADPKHRDRSPQAEAKAMSRRPTAKAKPRVAEAQAAAMLRYAWRRCNQQSGKPQCRLVPRDCVPARSEYDSSPVRDFVSHLAMASRAAGHLRSDHGARYSGRRSRSFHHSSRRRRRSCSCCSLAKRRDAVVAAAAPAAAVMRRVAAVCANCSVAAATALLHRLQNGSQKTKCRSPRLPAFM